MPFLNEYIVMHTAVGEQKATSMPIPQEDVRQTGTLEKCQILKTRRRTEDIFVELADRLPPPKKPKKKRRRRKRSILVSKLH